MRMLLVLCLLAQQNLIDERPDPSEMILIDGSKEPYKIPEWSAWQWAFHLMRDGKTRDELPMELYNLVTPADVALIVAAVRDSLENDAALEKRGIELYSKLLVVRQACDAKEKTKEQQTACFIREGRPVSAGWQDEEIGFRQRTLDIRDRLLWQLEEGGRHDVKIALVAWAEKAKAGIKAHIHKPNLAHYYKPR
jgi:hypothetical protein